MIHGSGYWRAWWSSLRVSPEVAIRLWLDRAIGSLPHSHVWCLSLGIFGAWKRQGSFSLSLSVSVSLCLSVSLCHRFHGLSPEWMHWSSPASLITIQDFKAGVTREQGRKSLTLTYSNSAFQIKQLHFCHILFTETITRLTKFQVNT